MDYAAHSAHVHSPGLSSLIVLLLPALLLVGYLLAAARQKQTGQQWSRFRSMSFTAGIGLLVLALVPPMTDFAHEDLRGHMMQHLLLGMFAPLGLVLGAPGTLLLRSIPASSARRLVSLLDTSPVRVLIHPLTALVLDMGGMVVLYLTPLYAWSTEEPALHFLVHLHFLLSGYLFTWSIAGPDPAPHRPGLRLRLAVLFIGTAIHATLAKLMYAYGYPRDAGHTTEEIQAAAQWMYYGGDLAELLLCIAFFHLWFRTRPRAHGGQTGPAFRILSP